ncbi:MAG: hypothetical protein U5K69_21400 [Balneolaceae bacterium]|nr:hypothetical protein [Balneolaceae bacterium]
MSKNRFKQQFVEWARNDYKLPEKKIDALKSIIDEQFWEELESRDVLENIVLRPLSNSDSVKVSHFADDSMIYPNEDNELIVGAITPNWKHGWHFVDDDVRDLLQFFLHFSEQYIARSRALNVTGAIALVYKIACDFRFKGLYSDLTERFSFDELRNSRYKPIEIESFELQEEFYNWLSILNCLDPLIHRIIYQFWKGTKLYSNNDIEDSVTSFTSCISVISEYCQNRLNQTEESRLEKIEALNIKTDSIDYLEDLELLRNRFSAHPSHTKWWDFNELFGEQLHTIIAVIKDIIQKLCEHESKNRSIKNNPEKWSSWLGNNSMLVFDSVWFHNLPPLKGEY